MATKYWQGTVTAVAQIATGSIDSVDGTPANNTFTVTIGGEAISQVGDTDVATTAAALVVLLEASTHPYFAAVTWTNPSAGNITGTADVAGSPFIAALTETGAGTGAVTDFSDDTACTGPNNFNDADNWSDGSVPGNSDTVILRDNSIDICWGLDDVTATAVVFVEEQTYTGYIGLDQNKFATSSNSRTTDATKPDYRTDYLTLDIATLDIGGVIGPGTPAGSKRTKINNDRASASTTTIHNTSSSALESGKPAVRLKFAHASADIEIRSGNGGVGIASDVPGETSTIGDVVVSGGKCFVADGVTWTTYTQSGGEGHLQAAASATSVTLSGGSLDVQGVTVSTMPVITGGTVKWQA